MTMQQSSSPLGPMARQADEAIAYLSQRVLAPPEIVIVLGSGLGTFADRVEDAVRIPYADIPHFPQSTVPGHAGVLVCGTVSGHSVAVMSGRFHYYEGYTMPQVTFPVRVFSRWGVRLLVLSNASGGVNPAFRPGDIMLIDDHINLMPNPLVGPNADEFGTRFPAMNGAYDPRYLVLAQRVAREMGIPLMQGCYVATTGPSFETPHEYHYFYTIGADAVGMSTVPEVIVARHCGLRVLAFSVVTNVGGLNMRTVPNHDEVQAAGAEAGVRLAKLLTQIIAHLDEAEE